MNEENRSLHRELEERARSIAHKNNEWEPSPRGMITRELCLAVDELDTTRQLHRALKQQLLDEDCRLSTELLQPQDPATKNRLHSQLAAVHAEQRRLATTEFDRIAAAHRRMLVLVEKHQTLMLDED